VKQIAGLLLAVTVAFGQNVYLSGTVMDDSGDPLEGATVTLAERGLEATSGSDGTYLIQAGATTASLVHRKPACTYGIKGNRFRASLTRPSRVDVSVYDIRGRLVARPLRGHFEAGTHEATLVPPGSPAQTRIVHVTTGEHRSACRLTGLGNTQVFSTRAAPGSCPGTALAKQAALAVVDTIEASRAGHGSVSLYVYSYIDTIDFWLGGSDTFTEWRQQCVHRINYYRSTIGLGPLARRMDKDSCVDSQCESDAASGTPHGAFGRCGEGAQNECPGWRSLTSIITGCLQSMWDEGPPPVPYDSCKAACYQAHGHYINMTSPKYESVACGFYITSEDKVWAVQDFWR
jgi:hypothetical protein